MMGISRRVLTRGAQPFASLRQTWRDPQGDEATALANSALHEQPNYPAANRILAASNAFAGHLSEAHEAMTRLRELDPSLRVSNLNEVFPLRRSDDLAKFAEGLRKAGLPD